MTIDNPSSLSFKKILQNNSTPSSDAATSQILPNYIPSRKEIAQVGLSMPKKYQPRIFIDTPQIDPEASPAKKLKLTERDSYDPENPLMSPAKNF